MGADNMNSLITCLENALEDLDLSYKPDEVSRRLIYFAEKLFVKNEDISPQEWDECGRLEKRDDEYADLVDRAVLLMTDEERTPGSANPATLEKIMSDIKQFVFLPMIKDPKNHRDAILTFQAGTGREASVDFGKKLFDAYRNLCDNHGLGHEDIYVNGTMQSMQIDGNLAYGLFRGEHGVHRFTYVNRGKRQTGFLSVNVEPKIEPKKPSFNSSDVRAEYLSASSPGGQHANKAETGVRLTHLPTSLTATARMRSRAQSLSKATEVLTSRVAEYQEEIAKSPSERAPVTFGSHFRTYNLVGHQYIKDHRSDTETKEGEEFFKGRLEQFLYAFHGIHWRHKTF